MTLYSYIPSQQTMLQTASATTSVVGNIAANWAATAVLSTFVGPLPALATVCLGKDAIMKGYNLFQGETILEAPTLNETASYMASKAPELLLTALVDKLAGKFVSSTMPSLGHSVSEGSAVFHDAVFTAFGGTEYNTLLSLYKSNPYSPEMIGIVAEQFYIGLKPAFKYNPSFMAQAITGAVTPVIKEKLVETAAEEVLEHAIDMSGILPNETLSESYITLPPCLPSDEASWMSSLSLGVL